MCAGQSIRKNNYLPLRRGIILDNSAHIRHKHINFRHWRTPMSTDIPHSANKIAQRGKFIWKEYKMSGDREGKLEKLLEKRGDAGITMAELFAVQAGRDIPNDADLRQAEVFQQAAALVLDPDNGVDSVAVHKEQIIPMPGGDETKH